MGSLQNYNGTVSRGAKKGSSGVEKPIGIYPGQYWDAETGTHYNYFRDYNPSIGRYIEADPVGIKRGRNHLFVGLKNSPIRYTDPKGLVPCSQRTKEFLDCMERCRTWLTDCLDAADKAQKDCESYYYSLCEKKFNNPISVANCKLAARVLCDIGSSEIKTGCYAGYVLCVAGCVFPPSDCGCEHGK